MLMMGYTHAAGPDKQRVDLSEMLDNHTWVQENALETRHKRRPTIEPVREADYQMRTKWMVDYCAEPKRSKRTFTDIVRHHREQSAYLFTDLQDEKPPPTREWPRRERTRTPPPMMGHGAPQAGGTTPEEQENTNT